MDAIVNGLMQRWQKHPCNKVALYTNPIVFLPIAPSALIVRPNLRFLIDQSFNRALASSDKVNVEGGKCAEIAIIVLSRAFFSLLLISTPQLPTHRPPS